MGQSQPFTQQSIALEPEALAAAGRAFDKAVADLGGGVTASAREVIAELIIHLAAQGERDPDVLCERALASAGNLA